MKYLKNYPAKDGFKLVGDDFKGSKEVEKSLLERGIIGEVKVDKKTKEK